jgi:short-subunit dehydrogenase
MEAKNVLITGASSGIGAATAILLNRHGYRLWGTIRNIARLPELPENLRSAVRFIEMDVTDEKSVGQAMKLVFEEAGQIDILINNAGYGSFGPLEETPIDHIRTQMETNYIGAIRMIQALLPSMRERNSGTIVNVTSLAAHFVIPFQIQYSASKFALRALTEGLRQELHPYNIRVFAVEPGDIRTRFNDATQFAPTDPSSPYQKWSQQAWNTIDHNLQIAPPPQVVAKVILKALLKGRKRIQRYTAGDFISRQFPLISRFLPDYIREWGIRLFYGIK